MSVVVVGSVALDSIKTPNGNRDDILGGSATFFSLAASRFTDVRVVAVVGDDFPEEHLELLKRHQVDTRGIEHVPGGKTFRWAGEYSEDYTSRTTLDTQLNVFEKFQPRLSEEYRRTGTLFLANIHPQLQLEVLSQVEDLNFVACDTMNLWIDTTRDILAEVMKRVDLLVINDEESFLLTGLANIHLAAEKILEMGPRYLIIKRGEFGAALFGEDRLFLLPAYPVTRLIDPTGAGDSFAGGMMGYLAGVKQIDFEALKQAVVLGALVASFSVEAFSVDRLVDLDSSELAERQRRFHQITGWTPLDTLV